MGEKDGTHQDKHQELKKIEESLKTEGLSRRVFLDRMKALGVGFGAAFILGVKDADALAHADAGVNVKSTDPALDDILAEAQESAADGGDLDEISAQRRRYGRFYRRGYRRYGRFYRRGYRRYGRFYRRGYRRYGRFYRRYARWYARF